MINRRRVLKVLMLILGLLMTGFAVSLYVKSNCGVSTISSLPYIFSLMVPKLSFGMATICFQFILMALLIPFSGFKKKYIYALTIGVFFGSLVDLFDWLITVTFLAHLPGLLMFILAFVLLPLGIALQLMSKLTAMPFDMYTQEMAAYTGRSIKVTKTIFDITCVLSTVILSYFMLGGVKGIGIGTIISMIFTGHIIHFFMNLFTGRFEILVTSD